MLFSPLSWYLFLFWVSISPRSVKSRPNILLILADDLGYADLSVSSFTGHGIVTPQLELMAASGLLMTNFHDAAPICTPTRASIITGLLPWRMGIYSIYGTGAQAKEHLTVIPNAALTFRDAGYHTAHVGKWHLGGMKPSDISDRTNKVAAMKSGKLSASSCDGVDPGPLQHGFVEYVAMAEGSGSHRLTNMIPRSTLYHEGSKHLVRNDEPLPPSDEILTARQTTEAIRIMNETIQQNKNFYMHLWFDAPHGPWETITPFDKQYSDTMWEGRESRNFKYATMVSSMDDNIGRLRRALADMHIEDNTLVVFLSDNGPENGAGSAGPFHGGKRSLHEGGIRVPCIWQWPGKIAAGTTTDQFAVSTDLFPTFMEAAGITRPSGMKLDGLSLLKVLMGKDSTRRGDERVVTWYKNIDGESHAAWSHGYKYLSDDHGVQLMFDMRSDKIEKHNLLLTSHEQTSVRSTTRIRTSSRQNRNMNNNSSSASQSISSTSTTESSHRSNKEHIDKVHAVLKEKAMQFKSLGNKPYLGYHSKHRCVTPNDISQIESFQWDLGSPAMPEL